MATELVALHDDNFCVKFHVSYACISEACAIEPRRRFVTEREKKKKPKNMTFKKRKKRALFTLRRSEKTLRNI